MHGYTRMTTKEFSSSRVPNLRAISYAVLVHVALIALLVVSLDWTPKVTSKPPMQVMQAVVMDEPQLRASAKKEPDPRPQEQERLQAQKEQQRREEQKQQERVQQQAKEKEQQKRAIAEQEVLKKQQALRQENLKKEQEVREKQAAQEKKEKQTAELEAKRKAEAEHQAEQKRRAENKRRIEAEEDALQEQLAAEQQRRDSERERAAKSALAKFSILIKQKVERNWLRPQTARQGMSCKVLVRLTAKGEVLLARVVESSGDTAYDRSVEAAVYKASPLPLPPDVTLFDYFREINFVFKPEE